MLGGWGSCFWCCLVSWCCCFSSLFPSGVTFLGECSNVLCLRVHPFTPHGFKFPQVVSQWPGRRQQKHGLCFWTSLRRSSTLKALKLGQADRLCCCSSAIKQNLAYLSRDEKLPKKYCAFHQHLHSGLWMGTWSSHHNYPPDPLASYKSPPGLVDVNCLLSHGPYSWLANLAKIIPLL